MPISNPHYITIDTFPFKWRCPSSRPNIPPYLVDLETNRCDCKAGRCKTPCKHVRWVNELVGLSPLWLDVIQNWTKTEAGWAGLRLIEAYLKDKYGV